MLSILHVLSKLRVAAACRSPSSLFKRTERFIQKCGANASPVEHHLEVVIGDVVSRPTICDPGFLLPDRARTKRPAPPPGPAALISSSCISHMTTTLE
jgi:hypothetical protein